MSSVRRLILSLPATELSRIRMSASFFGVDELPVAQLSQELGLALELVAAEAKRRNIELRLIARPEIFTSGETLAWLKRETTYARDHLCITDGSTLRVLPNLRTHAFFYRLGTHDGTATLGALAQRAPELLGQIVSQVNTAIGFAGGVGQSLRRPPTIILQPSSGYAQPFPVLLPFFLSAQTVDENTARISSSSPIAASALANAVSLTYVAVSGNGWAREGIAAASASLIQRAYLDPHAGVIILLPPAKATTAPAAALASRLSEFLHQLRDTGVPFPRAVPGNIMIATGPLHPIQIDALPARPNMIIDVSFDAWHHDQSFYERFGRITILLEGAQSAHWRRTRTLLRDLIGRSADVQYIQPTPSAPA